MESAVLEPIKPKTLKRINYALAATLLAAGVPLEQIVPQVNAKNANVLRVGLSKRGVTRSGNCLANVSQVVVQRASVAIATDAAEEIRNSLSRRLQAQGEAISSKPVNYSKLASKGQGEAAVLKTMAETHHLLYGGAEMNVLVFGVSSMEQPVQASVIDVPCVPDSDKSGL